MLTVLLDNDDDPLSHDPAGLHDLPSGLRTPPTPPVDPSQSPPASPLPRRLRAVAQFLFEFNAFRFESLDLPLLPADRSDFDVHRALEDDKLKTQKLFLFFKI
jgi:hypothetical protein